MKRSLLALILLLYAGMGSDVIFAQPQTYIDSLKDALTKGAKDTTAVNIYNELSFSYSSVNPDSGLRYGRLALSAATAQHWEKGIKNADNSIGTNYLSLSDYNNALKYFTDALVRYEKQGDKKGIATISSNIAVVYASQGKFSQSLQNFQRALSLYEALGDKASVARISGNISNIYADESDYSKAIEYNFRALKTYEETGDKNGEARILDNNAIIYYNIGNYKKALDYHFKALHMQEALGNQQEVTRIYSNIGNVYRDMHVYDTANMYFMKALARDEQLGNKDGTALLLNNIGIVHLQNKQYAAALSFLFRALRIGNEVGDKGCIASTGTNIGEVYLGIAGDSTGTIAPDSLIPAGRAANLAKAIFYLEQGAQIATAIDYPECVQESNQYLAEAYKMQGNYKKALAAYTVFNTIKDSVAFNKQKEKITRLETQRELDLKDKQIELDKLAVAKKRNERIFYITGILFLLAVTTIVFRNYRTQKKLNSSLSKAKQKTELRTEELKLSNAELNIALNNLQKAQQELIVAAKQKENELIRSRISQDIHDDISAELTRISWVSELARTKASTRQYLEVPGLLEKITDSSRETVAKLGEIIWTINPQNDTLEHLLSYMRHYIGKYLADTELQHHVVFPETGTDIAINPELKRNLFLVLKETLHNAVKYADAAIIDISFVINGMDYVFTITDNGRGIDPAIVQGSGNGMTNMRARMQHSGGSMNINSLPGLGTTIRFSGTIY